MQKGHEGDWETVCGVICLCAIAWTQFAITVFLICLQITILHSLGKLKSWLQKPGKLHRLTDKIA